MSRETFRRVLYLSARHLPGIGGVQGLDQLEPEDTEALLEQLADDLDREAAAWKAKP